MYLIIWLEKMGISWCQSPPSEAEDTANNLLQIFASEQDVLGVCLELDLPDLVKKKKVTTFLCKSGRHFHSLSVWSAPGITPGHSFWCGVLGSGGGRRGTRPC